MKVSRNKIAKIIGQRSLNSTSGKQLADQTAAYLLSENRIGELDSLLRDIWQYRSDNGVIEVIAITAYPLKPEIKAIIESTIRRAYPQAQKVIIDEQLNPKIIGGVKLELANQQMDISLRSELDKFKQLAEIGKD